MGKQADRKPEEEEEEVEEEEDEVEEAMRLKSIAERGFASSNLKSALHHAKKAHRLCPSLDGLSSMLTAFQILRLASKPPESSSSSVADTTTTTTTDWYKIFQVEPFSHINTIKKQYKKLALELHPDKNSHAGCEEAFKLVGEGFRVLSDKIRRKEYDMRLRIRLQDEKVSAAAAAEAEVVETFWTACSRCRLLHQFERRYLGHNLVCPSCKKSFEAVEVDGVVEEDDSDTDTDTDTDGDGDGVVSVRSERLRRKMAGGDGSGREVRGGGVEVEGKKSEGSDIRWGSGRLRSEGLRRKVSSVDDILERSIPKKVKVADEMMTLKQMQLEAKKKSGQNKVKKLKEKQKDAGGLEKEKEKEESGKSVASKKDKELRTTKLGGSEMGGDMEIETRGVLKKCVNKETVSPETSRDSVRLGTKRRRRVSGREELEIVSVEDSDFYDFKKDRVERSVKKGQVWAIYDDDRMPRHYGLIDEVVSVNPFEVNLSWLDPQSREDERLISWKKRGFHVSCGEFQVAGKMIVDSVSIFSHVVECERAARAIYRIYPNKGSVWALCNESNSGANGRKQSTSAKHSYSIVVFLTAYSEIYGMSIAYLEKVDGYKTLFRRQEVGYHAVRCLGKDDIQLLSHQIPAKKLSADEIPELLKDCWELDAASLPENVLTIGGGNDS